MREKWIRKSASNPLFLFFARHNGSIGSGQKKNFLENADFS